MKKNERRETFSFYHRRLRLPRLVLVLPHRPRAAGSGTPSYLVIPSPAKNHREPFCRCRVVHVPLPKFRQWPTLYVLRNITTEHIQSHKTIIVMSESQETQNPTRWINKEATHWCHWSGTRITYDRRNTSCFAVLSTENFEDRSGLSKTGADQAA